MSTKTAHTRKRRRRRRRSPIERYGPIATAVLLVVVIAVLIGKIVGGDTPTVPRWVDQQILSETAGGRRVGENLTKVNDIVIHYVGNPGSTAQQNHDYYENPNTKVSSHFLIGLDGEIIQCLPLEEKSSASNDRNADTISIEVCHPDASGQFTDAGYRSAVKLTAWLCDSYHIGRDHVIRHYDVTGKLCPLYFVDHPEAWEQFLSDVKHA